MTTEQARVESEEAATTTLKPRQHVVVDDSDLETEQQRQRVIELSKTILENDQQLESEEGEGEAVQRPKKSLTSSGSSGKLNTIFLSVTYISPNHRYTHDDSFIFSLYFYKERAQNNESKEHCLCIKENQNKSSQSFLRNPLILKLPYLMCAHSVGGDPYSTYGQNSAFLTPPSPLYDFILFGLTPPS